MGHDSYLYYSPCRSGPRVHQGIYYFEKTRTHFYSSLPSVNRFKCAPRPSPEEGDPRALLKKKRESKGPLGGRNQFHPFDRKSLVFFVRSVAWMEAPSPWQVILSSSIPCPILLCDHFRWWWLFLQYYIRRTQWWMWMCYSFTSLQNALLPCFSRI